MKEVECVKLENNLEYIILETEIINGIEYLYLVNSQDDKDYVIRKKVDGNLVGLDNDAEFEVVMNDLMSKFERYYSQIQNDTI